MITILAFVVFVSIGLFIGLIVGSFLVGVIRAMRSKPSAVKVDSESFEDKCWLAKLRRETMPTEIVHAVYEGQYYVAVCHGMAEAPALILSMQRMMIEADEEKLVEGKMKMFAGVGGSRYE